jgi:AraC-like DNA-binding protein
MNATMAPRGRLQRYFAPKFMSFTLAGEQAQVSALLGELRERNCVSLQVTRYADRSLYLPLVAEEFEITKEYLSQFFNEQTGKNSSVYLERLRIARAKELLAATGQNLSRIARQYGYNSPPVFRQSFKRVEGITPSQFRDLAAACSREAPSGSQGPRS